MPLRSLVILRFCNSDTYFALCLWLCVSRYKAVVKPLERQPSNAILKTCAKAGCVWIVSMIIALPEAIFSNVYTFRDPNRNRTFEACASYPVSERLLQEIHSLLCFLVFYLIPLSIISVYYSLIARTLYKSTLNIPTEEQSHARKQVRIHRTHASIWGKIPTFAPVSIKCNSNIILLSWSWSLESLRPKI